MKMLFIWEAVLSSPEDNAHELIRSSMWSAELSHSTLACSQNLQTSQPERQMQNFCHYNLASVSEAKEIVMSMFCPLTCPLTKMLV